MTEAEWVTTGLPLYMLRQYPFGWNGRKVRLFWCACLRRIWDQLDVEQSQRLVELVENDPDNCERLPAEFRIARAHFLATNTEPPYTRHPYYWLLGMVLEVPPESLMSLVDGLAQIRAGLECRGAGLTPLSDSWQTAFDAAERAEKAWQCDMLREVFGNPFRPVDVAPWRTSDVLLLARGIYEERAFDRMPILADALQDAGCENVNVLDHCRLPGEHVRGCWVIDMLLGK
jgi:hypothetical protein